MLIQPVILRACAQLPTDSIIDQGNEIAYAKIRDSVDRSFHLFEGDTGTSIKELPSNINRSLVRGNYRYQLSARIFNVLHYRCDNYRCDNNPGCNGRYVVDLKTAEEAASAHSILRRDHIYYQSLQTPPHPDKI